jgi:hypothetical protein
MELKMRNNRRSKEDGHMAQLIRRKMIQQSVPSKKAYNRKKSSNKACVIQKDFVY